MVVRAQAPELGAGVQVCNLSVPQFLQLKHKVNNSTHLLGFL